MTRGLRNLHPLPFTLSCCVCAPADFAYTTANFITDIRTLHYSGVYEKRVGFPKDHAVQVSLASTDWPFCAYNSSLRCTFVLSCPDCDKNNETLFMPSLLQDSVILNVRKPGDQRPVVVRISSDAAVDGYHQDVDVLASSDITNASVHVMFPFYSQNLEARAFMVVDMSPDLSEHDGSSDNEPTPTPVHPGENLPLPRPVMIGIIVRALPAGLP